MQRHSPNSQWTINNNYPHSSSSTSAATPTKKPPRRKPPPGIETPNKSTPQIPTVLNTSASPSKPIVTKTVSTPPGKSLPPLPIRPVRPVPPIANQPPVHSKPFVDTLNPKSMPLKINTSPSLDKAYEDNSASYLPQSNTSPYNDASYTEHYESYFAYESPKPMGPKELPDYIDVDSPFSSRSPHGQGLSISQRLHQHQHEEQPLPPIPPQHQQESRSSAPPTPQSPQRLIQRPRSNTTRKFQSLSQKSSRSPMGPVDLDTVTSPRPVVTTASPTPPYPTDGIDIDLDIIATYNDEYDSGTDKSYEFFNPDMTPSEDANVSHDPTLYGSPPSTSSSPPARRYSHSGSPSRVVNGIPPLSSGNQLSRPEASTILKPQKSMPVLRNDVEQQQPQQYFGHPSTSPNRRHGIAKFNSVNNKPTPALTISAAHAQAAFMDTLNEHGDAVGGNAHSSSPKRLYGRSPSLIYTSPFSDRGNADAHDVDVTENTEGNDYNANYDEYDDTYNNYYSQYYNDEEPYPDQDEGYERFNRPSRWSSGDSNETNKTDISDYYDNINIDNGQLNSANTMPSTVTSTGVDKLALNGYATPTNTVFDYSILPDLPSASSNDTTGINRHLTMNSAVSAISFLKNNLLQDDNSSPQLSALTRKKKHDELPPIPLDLPSLPFSSSSLVTQHFATCEQVWSLSSVFEWCLKLKVWLHDSFISKREFKKALIKLIVFHRRDVPLDLIGQNADRIIEELLQAKAIAYFYEIDDDEPEDKDDEKPLPELQEGGISPEEAKTNGTSIKNSAKNNGPSLASKDEPGIKMDETAYVSGVMTDLTECYCHDDDHGSVSGRRESKTADDSGELKLRCYSFNCNLNRMIDHEVQLKNTNINEIILAEDWSSHWKLTAEDLRKFDKNVSKRQSLIFDLLRYEQTFIQRAKCFVEIVGPEFIKIAQLLVGAEIVSVNRFEDDMIKPGKELVEIHEKTLFHPLLRILIADGKFIANLSEIATIYYNWSQVVKNSLLKYMSTVPMIEDLLKYDTIKRWVDHNVRNMKKVKELKVNGPLLFMSTFNSRYQSLPLQLSDIRKSFDTEEPEYVALSKAIDGIKRLGGKVNEMKVHADNIHALKRVHKHLVWKSNILQPNINLGSENRRFLFRGDLSRKGDLKINTYINHIILLDNYLFITEKIKNQRTGGLNYKVVENPIPVELLLFEIKENQSVATAGGIEISLSKTLALNSSASPISPEFSDIHGEDEPSSFPLKLRYAGRGKHNAFTFSAKTERERMDWINHFITARSNLCSRLRKTEPYKLSLISNTNFAYEYNNRVTKLQLCAPHDPIEDISSDAFNRLSKQGFNGDVYSMVNPKNHIVFSKALSVSHFEFRGTNYYLVGLINGVYLSDMQNRWKKVINATEVTKISVVTSINLVVVLGNKQLRYYPLDSIINVYYERRDSMSSVSLSNEPVAFYEIGRHREITMLFYAKKKGNSSGTTNFKVLIPETDNDGVFNTFKVVKKFYVEAECFGISIFNTSFAVHTHKGFEILELDKLIPRSIPDIPNIDSRRTDVYGKRILQNSTSLSMQTSSSITSSSHPGIDAIKRAMHSNSIKPMGMFKLTNNSEFLLVYNDYAIFTNKHGKLSRFTMLTFDFKAKAIGFKNNNLFLVCDEAIEIWSISDFVNGSNRLIQVITGKEINMLDTSDLCFAMANPKVVGLQLVFRLDPVSTEADPLT